MNYSALVLTIILPLFFTPFRSSLVLAFAYNSLPAMLVPRISNPRTCLTTNTCRTAAAVTERLLVDGAAPHSLSSVAH